jgi:hypothetical protein
MFQKSEKNLCLTVLLYPDIILKEKALIYQGFPDCLLLFWFFDWCEDWNRMELYGYVIEEDFNWHAG